jgi:hypothetical protein
MAAVGGFFELDWWHTGSLPHPGCLVLATGRACLRVILQQARPKRVWVPFYTCDASLRPFAEEGIPTAWYSLGADLFPEPMPQLAPGDMLLWTNYFGLMGHHTRRLIEVYGAAAVILDETHHLFEFERSAGWSFTSIRKYFGVPDGAFLHTPVPVSLSSPRLDRPRLDAGALRLLGRQAEAFAAFREHEAGLDCEVRAISERSERMLRGLDLDGIGARRRQNLAHLHQRLGGINTLKWQSSDTPFCYPFLPPVPIPHARLHALGYFVPRLWPEPLTREDAGFAVERHLSQNLLPLPVDHRYDPGQLDPMVDAVLDLLAETRGA